jgi:membrane protease YdiL (CAAX protease family)
VNTDVENTPARNATDVMGFSRIGLRQLLWAPLLGTLIGVALVVAFVAVWMVIYMNGTHDGAGTATSALQRSFYANMAIIVAIYVPTIAMLWNAARKLTPAPAVRFFPPVKVLTVALALITGVLASLLCLSFETFLSSKFGISFDLSPAEQAIFPTTTIQLLLAFAVIGFIGPFAEEFYFRGFLLQALRQRMGVVPAVLVSALAFGIVHFFMLVHPGASGWATTGEIVAVGIVMGAWVARTGSLWTSLAVHVGYNCVVTLQMFLPST